jgi:hypothetical protein
MPFLETPRISHWLDAASLHVLATLQSDTRLPSFVIRKRASQGSLLVIVSDTKRCRAGVRCKLAAVRTCYWHS